MSLKIASRGIRIWRRIAQIAVSIFGVWMGARIILFIDAISHGPYCAWYNYECKRLSIRAGLVGRPEADVETVLGVPSSVWEYDQPNGRTRTYNYAPSIAPSGKFQVHCRGGVVVGLEQFDD